ncbi:MAG: AraC family transcriptional regulator [Bacteroidota bacterium]
MTMITKVRAAGASELINQLGRLLSLSPQKDCQRTSLQIPPRYGQGRVFSYQISPGMDAIIFEVELKNDWCIEMEGDFAPPINFYALSAGTFVYTDKRYDETSFIMEPLQSAIQAIDRQAVFQWQFPANQAILFSCIMVHKEAFFAEVDCDTLQIPANLLDVAKDLSGEEKFFYGDIYHLPIINALNDVAQQEELGLINSTFAAAKIYEITTLLLEVYKSSSTNENSIVLKPDAALVNIRNAEEILSSRLQDPPTIKELSKMVGINQQTLKRGFKQLYGETINRYLNDKRLEQAGILIKAGEMKLQDIALEVGYSNPSHFTRRFKERFGVSPRTYRQQSNTKVKP